MSERQSSKIEDSVQKKAKLLDTYYKDDPKSKKKALKEHRKDIEDSWAYRNKKKIEIEIGKAKRVTVNRLIDATKNLALENDLPTGINIELLTNDIDVSLSVEKSYNTLRLRVTPDDKEFSRKVFSDFNDWVNKYRPRRWEQLWNSLYGLQWILFPIFSGVLITFASVNTTTYKSEAINVAHSLLENGLHIDESTQALEILLTLETSYVPAEKVVSDPIWLGYGILILFLTAIVLSIRPKFDIAIGKGKSRIYLWKWWIKLISITVPTFLFGTIFLPKIMQYLNLS